MKIKMTKVERYPYWELHEYGNGYGDDLEIDIPLELIVAIKEVENLQDQLEELWDKQYEKHLSDRES